MQDKLPAASGPAQVVSRKALAEIDVKKMEFFGKTEIFLKDAIAGKGIGRIGIEHLVMREAHRAHVGLPFRKARVLSRLVHGMDAQAAQPAHKHVVEGMHDARLAGQEKAQPARRDLIQRGALAAKAQGHDRLAVPCGEGKFGKLKGHDFRVIGRAKRAWRALHGFRQHSGPPGDEGASGEPFRRLELDDAAGGQLPQIVGPEQIEQGIGDLRQFVVQLFAQAAGKKGDPLKDALHVRVPAGRIEKRRKSGVARGKFPPQGPQGDQLPFIIVVDAHVLLRHLPSSTDTVHVQGSRRPSCRIFSAWMEKSSVKGASSRMGRLTTRGLRRRGS